MASVSCPSCFALVRSPASGRFRGFLHCPSCGHRFLASIEDLPARTVPAATQAFSPSELAAAIGGKEVPEEADFTRESTRHEEAVAPERVKAALVHEDTRVERPLDRFRFVIGREGADLDIDDPAISRRHALIENHSNRFLLKDTGSTNGTFLNGRRVSVEFLENGDVLQFGRTRLRFEKRP